MPPNNIFTLSQITPTRYETLLQAASGQYPQADVSGNSGSASSDSMSIGWTYYPADQQLTVEVFRKPAFMSMQSIASELMGLLG